MQEFNQSYQLNINATDLKIDKKEIYRILGYSDHNLPENIVNDVDELLPLAFAKMEILGGYQEIPKTHYKVSENSFSVDNIDFQCGKIILNHLKGTEKALFFVATLGNEFDDYSKEFIKQGDPYKAYLVDCIGSLTVECAIDWFMTNIENDLKKENLSCTNRFSPGYCNWNVSEQHKLFSKLPEGFLGIELLESSLMKPIKSVSGMVGIGKNIKKMKYTCHICDQKDCIMRKR